ncbi:MAG TPA: ATP-binding domain-containing protein [Phycisphaerae bacterium]|nr:ATP-binding domain-containing protein [Phycisphaerae bacterium]
MSWVKQLSVYDDLDYKPRDHPGEILTSQATWRHPDTAVMTAEAMLEAGKSVMFAASCGYMLFPLIAMLRDRGIPFANPWRTRHGGWNPLGKRRGVTASMRLLAFLRPDYETHGSEARQWTNEELGQWASVMTAKGTIIQGAKKVLAETAKVEPDLLVELATLLARFEAAPITELLDMFRLRDPMTDPPPGAERPTVQMLAAWWTGRMQGSKLQAVDYPVRILSTAGADVLMKPPRCFVGTIHSFKGSEADCVFLFPDLSNAGYEEWRAAGKSRDGVIRLMYVGMTRARETLVLCRRAGSTGVEW